MLSLTCNVSIASFRSVVSFNIFPLSPACPWNTTQGCNIMLPGHTVLHHLILHYIATAISVLWVMLGSYRVSSSSGPYRSSATDWITSVLTSLNLCFIVNYSSSVTVADIHCGNYFKSDKCQQREEPHNSVQWGTSLRVTVCVC